MTTPRKSAPRKAAPKKPVEQKVADFSRYRDRARNVHLRAEDARHIEPYIIGPDEGFDPPIVVEFPDKLSDQVKLDQASRAGDTFGTLNILLGGQLLRVVQAFETQEDGHRLVVGLAFTILDHFLGQGASEVPGGSPAS